MPNWVNNQLVIKGNKETLEEIARKGKPYYTVPKGMSVADFIRDQYKNSLCKKEVIEGLVDRYKDIVPTEDGHIPMIDIFGHEDVFSFENFVPQQKDDPRYQNGKEHNCSTVFNWYDWNCDNWGTKWDASETRLSWEGDDLVINFDTAWNVPSRFIEKLSHLYPDVIFDVYAYEEQGQYTSGRYAGGAGMMDSWVWCTDLVDKEVIARKFLEDFGKANGVEDILNIVDLDSFVDTAYFEVDTETDIRKYATPTVIVYDDDKTDLAEWLTSSSEGEWSYDSGSDKFVYTP